MTKDEYIKEATAAQASGIARWKEIQLSENPEEENESTSCAFCSLAIACKNCILNQEGSCCDGAYHEWYEDPSEENAQLVIDFLRGINIEEFADELVEEGIITPDSDK
jgi:hypothetical protein